MRALLLLLFCLQAHAYVDPKTGMSWQLGQQADGHREATFTDSFNMLVNAGFINEHSIYSGPGPYNYAPRYDPVRIASIAVFADAFEGQQMGGYERFEGVADGWSIGASFSPDWGFAPYVYAVPYFGEGTDKWLVSGFASHAPEPATWGLMLAGLALVARRTLRPPSPCSAQSSP